MTRFVFFLQSDWFGNSLYELIHPEDVEKLREQLSTGESHGSGRILDLKSSHRFFVFPPKSLTFDVDTIYFSNSEMFVAAVLTFQ